MNRLNFNLYFVSYGEFTRIFGDFLLEEFGNYDDLRSENIKNNVRNLVNKEKTLISKYIGKKIY